MRGFYQQWRYGVLLDRYISGYLKRELTSRAGSQPSVFGGRIALVRRLTGSSAIRDIKIRCNHSHIGKVQVVSKILRRWVLKEVSCKRHNKRSFV